MVAEIGVSIFCWRYTALTPPILVIKIVFGKVNANSCCVPHLKSIQQF